jgi:catalase (peroxidase I)
MLLSDWMLREEDDLHTIVREYAADEDMWFVDFAFAFKRLTEAGLEDPDSTAAAIPTAAAAAARPNPVVA